MVEFNFSEDSEYHSQINNRVIPHGSCNTTSMVMALKQAGIEIPFGSKDCQCEDFLTSFLRQKEAYEKMRELTPWFFDNGKPLYPPNQVHAMLQWAVNTLLGKEVDAFSCSIPIPSLVEHLQRGGGAVLSGCFVLSNGKRLRHIVSLAGYMEENDELAGFLLDDPYGDWRRDYIDHRGNDIPMKLEDFHQIFHPCGNEQVKWAHLVGDF